jgi:hypothetical protein
MWHFVEEPWQYRVLDLLPSGVDKAQLERALQMTPAERLDAVVKLMELAEELREGVTKKVGT